MIDPVALAETDAAAVEHLLDRAFGTDRHARTAYRIRAGAVPVAHLSFAAIEDGTLVGTIQCWPVALAGDDGSLSPLTMIGPVAVAPERQQSGIGRRLMEASLAAAAASGEARALMLIGDPEYYARFFGFTAERTGDWRAPGPIEARRLLARGDAVPDRAGLLVPRAAVARVAAA